MTDSREKLWERARRYIAQNQSAPARATLESLLARVPGDRAAHMVLAGLFAADDRQRAATQHVLMAAQVPPEDPGLVGELVAALLKVGQIVEARRLLDLPVVGASKSAQVLLRAASQRQLIGEHAAALALMEKAVAAGAGGRDFHFQHAVQLAFNGRFDESRAALERCTAQDPPLGRAFVQLVRMQGEPADDRRLGKVDAALRRVQPGGEDHAALEFARYEVLEDLQRYDEAWQSLARGNAVMHARLPHDPVREALLFDRLIETCHAEFLRHAHGDVGDGPQPIFVIGMPRSGTTVLERMLGNHPQVRSAGELGAFPQALTYATDHLAPVMFDETTLARAPKVAWDEVGRMYLAQSAWRANGKRLFVDKLPRNWMLAGMIHKALPHARILHLVRDPMDVCFSNWRAYFGPGVEYAYAYDLAALAAHHRSYRKVMAHWHAAMPEVILDVPYERLVNQPEAMIREVLAFCGLPWEPGCVEITRNAEPSATLSMSQVRQPVHTRAFEEWQPYSTQLVGLRAALAQ